MIYVVPTADVQMNSKISLFSKFVYQSSLNHVHDDDELARLFLQIVSQLFEFIADNMQLILFKLNLNDQKYLSKKSSIETQRSHVIDAIQIFEELISHQRSQTMFVANSRKINLSLAVTIVIISFMNCFLHLSHDVDFEAHYECLSKRALTFSELFIFSSIVIDTTIQSHQVHDAKCVSAEMSRMLKSIIEKTLSFAVKMPQALSDQDTFLIQTEATRQRAFETLIKKTAKMFCEINDNNKHLHTCSLIIQDLIDDETAALFFFVIKTEQMIFIFCTDQIMNSIEHWNDAYIFYDKQDRYRKIYASILKRMTRYIHEKEYRKLMNADVMTDSNDKQLIVDLNVRTANSHSLKLLKKHFLMQRNLHEAVLFFSLYLKDTRADFERAFEKRLRERSLITYDWCHDRVDANSISCLILAVENKEKLNKFIDEVNQHKLQ